MAQKDLYKILGLSKNATEEEIRSSYKKLAMKYHPDRNKNKSESELKELTERFKEINNAYEILSDAKKRSEYDNFGEVGHQAHSHGASHNFGGFPSDIFKQHFDFFGDGFDFSFNSGAEPRGAAAAHPKEIINYNVVCSLDDLYAGTRKVLKIKRKNVRGMTEEKIMEITIKPGYKVGTKFTFNNYGNYKNGSYQDICAILCEKPGELLQRVDNDLVYNLEISFRELIEGFSHVVILPGLRSLRVSQEDFQKIGEPAVFPRYGMPISKDPTRKGSLKVNLITNLPVLTAEQRAAMQRILNQR